MRKRNLVIVSLIVILAVDVILASIPPAAPTKDAISNAEQNQSFMSIVSSANATYTYFGYSNDPQYSNQCITSFITQMVHFLSPFHEYTTTSLIFLVQPFLREGVASNSSNEPFLLFVQMNPSTGQVLSIQKGILCA